MLQKTVIAISLALTFLISAPAHASVPLFQETKAGMTLDEVLSVQPAAIAVNEPGKGLGPTAPCLAYIGSYTVGAQDFEICYVFKDGRLSHVLLGLKKEPMHFDYQQLLTLLRTKYGPETSEGVTHLAGRPSGLPQKAQISRWRFTTACS
jgi:hypothetical protein